MFGEETLHMRQWSNSVRGSLRPRVEGHLRTSGETILLLEAESKTGALVKGRRRREADVTWHRGLLLGRAEQKNEHVVETELGVFLTRSVRRPEEQRGDEHVVKAMKGVPWEGRQGSKVERPRRQPKSVPLFLPWTSEHSHKRASPAAPVARGKVSTSSSLSAPQDSPNTFITLAVSIEPQDTIESRLVASTSAASSDPDAMES